VTGPAHAELAELALDVAREAAALVRERRAAGVTVAATKSSDVDVVTEADRATEELIRKRLAAARPGDALLGEEGDDVAGRSGVRWVVDPIDGTVNFLYGLPQYAVSIAAEVDGVVVAGVVVNAATGVEYVAHRADGGGAAVATRDGVPVTVRGSAPLAHRLLATGFNYDAEMRRRQVTALGALIGRVRDIRRIGACSLDLCLVADGSLDGYFEEGINLWDHAAGGLVAELAGARVLHTTGAGGRAMVVCAPAHGFDELLAALDEAGFLAP
jgi:myo-inositol-1(or 4)-monophosphatase